MNTKLCDAFKYDYIISLSSDVYTFQLLNDLRRKNILIDNSILSTTFNHRFYNIHEKNLIKGLIDEFDLDHLMFSLKPSAFLLLKTTPRINLDKFKYFSQVIFTLQCMQRYNIENAIISKKYFDILEEECNASIISNLMVDYINEFVQILTEEYPNKNIKKLFCSIINYKNFIKFSTKYTIKFDKKFYKNSNNFIPFNFTNQISEIEKDIFWIGFDSKFIDVPWNKVYPETKWTSLTNSLNYGEPTYNSKIKYCSRCCMPETMEGITFDEFDICTPCRSSEEKMHIDWEEREEKLQTLLKNSIKDEYYDCMLPMSGGKDSMFQAYILTQKYNIMPLAVTHGANWMSLSGRYNL